MTHAGLGILLVAGFAAAILHGWLGFAWPWLALVLLVALSLVMYQRGSVYYNQVRRAVGPRTYQDKPDTLLPEPLPTDVRFGCSVPGDPRSSRSQALQVSARSSG